jgi:hypothetical protein
MMSQPAKKLKMHSTIRIVLLLTLAMGSLFATAAASAQSTFGSIIGTVTDAAGAVIPGALIEAKEATTGVLRTATSDGHGDFSLVNLDAGVYVVTVSSTGFEKRQFNEVHLLARETVKIESALKVSTDSQAIEVTAGAAPIDADLTLSDSKSGQQISELALNFRASNTPSPIIVANLAPQVQPDQSGNISIAGGLPNETSFSLDGISTQNVRNGGPNTDLFPSVESIAEFKVNSGSNNAEFGQVSDLTVISKSGTNQYHGALFYFTQNAAFNAADPFVGKVLPVVANDFGVTLGGPASIPHFYDGKDKTFFFFTYEGVRRPQTVQTTEILPSTSQRAGHLTNPVLNPCTGAITNDISNCINPASAKALAAYFPLPNITNGPNDAINQFTLPGTYDQNGYDGRVDQVINHKQKAYVRYSQKQITNSGTDGDANYNPLLGLYTIQQKLKNLAGSWNYIITPTIVNEFRAGLSFVNTAQVYPAATQGAAVDTSLGITNLPPVPSSGGASNFQVGNYVDPSGAVAGNAGTNGVGRPRHVQQHIYELGDNLTYLKGTHSIKAGFDYVRNSYVDQITFTAGDEFGDYYYAGLLGDPLADFLTGVVTEADYAQNGPDGRPYASHYGFFAQDDWKVNKKLTVSYGFRYEINPPFNDKTDQLAQFDRNYPGGRLITQGAKGLALVSPSWRAQVGNTPFVTNDAVGLPITLRNTYYGNYQPRLGFAYDPFGGGKTIVKAHVGSYSVPVLGAVLYSLLGVNTSNFPEFITSKANPLTFPTVFGGSGTYPVNCNSPSTLPAGGTAGSASCPGYRRANDENLKDPRVVQWNASVEQEFSHSTVLRMVYTGSHTTQLIYSPDLNQVAPNTATYTEDDGTVLHGYAALTATPALRQQNLKYPNFAEVLTRDNGPSAKYNALTVEVERRFGKGLTFDASYNWAHNGSNALGSAPSSLIGDGGQGDNGPNTLDYYDIHRDYGNVIFTRRNRFVDTFNYTLPYGRGQMYGSNISRTANLFLGGWNLTGITVWQSGAFLTPTFTPFADTTNPNGTPLSPSDPAYRATADDPSGTNPGQRSAGAYQRPDYNPGIVANTKPGYNQYFNVAAFAAPKPDIGRFGDAWVGMLRGPSLAVFSSSLGKNFDFTERLKLRYEADFSNLFNVKNNADPNTNITSGSFGVVSSVVNQEQAGPRKIQMSLRLAF